MSRLEKNMDDLHIGVIGSGGRGTLARTAHKPGEGSRVVACCDITESVFDHNREWYGDDIYTTVDYHQLLQQDLDAVFVCSPDFLHQDTRWPPSTPIAPSIWKNPWPLPLMAVTKY